MIISNPDIIISEDSILKMFEILETRPNVGMITGVIHDSLGRIVNNFAWKLPGYNDLLINSSIILTKIAKLFNLGQLYRKSLIEKSRMLRVDVVPGCFFAISSKVITEVDYFDERTFLFHEENILAHKLKNAKYENFVITTEKVTHLESISIKKTFNSLFKRRQINFESSLVYMKEYLGCSGYLIDLYSIVYKLFDFENLVIYKLKSAKDIYFK
jgi:GT2 family glycosyltransferase